jgi:hypothetical protein
VVRREVGWLGGGGRKEGTLGTTLGGSFFNSRRGIVIVANGVSISVYAMDGQDGAVYTCGIHCKVRRYLIFAASLPLA